jgi:hypothetical protein
MSQLQPTVRGFFIKKIIHFSFHSNHPISVI